jgi:DNA-binding transcriptional MerR regulator
VEQLPSASELTVEALAARTGVTVRNIRAYQTKGLLPSPRLRGRTGLYGTDHVARLRLIKEMQASGFGLKAIKTLLDAAPSGAEDEVLRFERTLLAPWSSEEPELVRIRDLANRFGNPPVEVAARAQELGLIEIADDDHYLVRIPSLVTAAEELQALGVPISDSLEVVARVLRNAEAITKTFVDVFLKHVWRPFDRAGRPAERWPEVRESLERLRPIGSRVVQSLFAASMRAAVEGAFAEELERSAVPDERAV